MNFYVVASVNELASTPQMHVQLNGEEILLCRDGETYYAISYYCSHEAFTLEGGTISNHCITCPYHGAEFDLRSGEALSSPAWEPVRTFPVRVEGETVSIATD